MNEILNTMKNLPDYFGLSGASQEQIASAEQQLHTCFAEDYRKYLSACGVASVNGHELTGICASARLNVVSVTQEMVSQHPGALPGWYVIEQANIDGIVIWQAPDGTVYQTQPNMEAVRISSGLLAYIK